MTFGLRVYWNSTAQASSLSPYLSTPRIRLRHQDDFELSDNKATGIGNEEQQQQQSRKRSTSLVVMAWRDFLLSSFLCSFPTQSRGSFVAQNSIGEITERTRYRLSNTRLDAARQATASRQASIWVRFLATFTIRSLAAGSSTFAAASLRLDFAFYLCLRFRLDSTSTSSLALAAPSHASDDVRALSALLTLFLPPLLRCQGHWLRHQLRHAYVLFSSISRRATG